VTLLLKLSAVGDTRRSNSFRGLYVDPGREGSSHNGDGGDKRSANFAFIVLTVNDSGRLRFDGFA
jgi:hypothetical protein